MARRKKIVFQISAREKAATASLRRLSARFQKLMQPIDRLNNKLRANERALKPIVSRLNRIGNKYKKLGENATLGITAPLTLAGAATAKVATDFETGMIKVKALTGSTSEEFIRMRNLAKSLGATTQFSAKEAAEGMSFLGMAGFKSKEIIKAIPGVMDLAAASQLELGEASDYASNILTAFGKKAGQMSEVSDKLTYAFTNSNTTLTELHNGLAKVGGVAVKAGVGFEDITASMMALADAGHKGETAGVALAGALSRITKFTSADKANEVTKTLAKLGIYHDEFLDKSTGRFKVKFQDFIKLLDEHGAQLSDYQKIFGQDAGKYIVGLSDNFEKLNGYLEGIKYNADGLTKIIAKMYMSGTGGAFKLLISALEGLMVKLGDTGFLKVINASMRSLGYFLSDISSASNSTLTFALALGGVAMVFGPVAYGLGVMFHMLKKFTVMLGLTNLALLSTGSLIVLGTLAVAGLAYGIWWAFNNTERFKKGLDWLMLAAADFAYLIPYNVKKGMYSLLNIAIEVVNEVINVIQNSGFGFLLGTKPLKIPTIKIEAPDLPSAQHQRKLDAYQQYKDNQRVQFGVDETSNVTWISNVIEASQPEKQLSPLQNVPMWEPIKFLDWSQKTGGLPPIKWFPDAITKGFKDVFDPILDDDEEFDPKVLREGFDFASFKQELIQKTTINEKQQLDVNIKLDGADRNTRVEVRNRSRSTATVDTGRIMVNG